VDPLPGQATVHLSTPGGMPVADGRVLAYPAAVIDGVAVRDVRVVIADGKVCSIVYRDARGMKLVTDGDIERVEIQEKAITSAGCGTVITLCRHPAQPAEAATADDGFIAAVRRVQALLDGPVPAAFDDSAPPASAGAPPRPMTRLRRQEGDP
jgi:hypothetical protein